MKVTNVLEKILADSYALYLKTQNYHWNVTGSDFKTLHLLFEEQYQDLTEAIDEIAERIRTLEQKVSPFANFIKLSSISSPTIEADSRHMLEDLGNDQKIIVESLYKALDICQKERDEGSADMLIGRIKAHEKNRWMLKSSIG